MSQPRRLFTVFGCWPATRERFGEFVEATDARDAEDYIQSLATARQTDAWVCGVLDGEVEAADLYTAFVDPADPRNEDVEDLQPDTDELEVTAWTVLGIARDASDPDAYAELVGERYADVVEALSPGAAEDVARGRLAEQGGELWVCAVVPGKPQRADTYATFVDPDVVGLRDG
jgi:hypothetical protein